MLLPVCTTPLNEGCNALEGLKVANLYKRVADKFISDYPDDFCSEGIKMIYAPIRRQNTTMVSLSNKKLPFYFVMVYMFLNTS